MNKVSLSEYAKHRGVAKSRISYLLKEGRLKKSAQREGRRVWIDPEIADRELEKNLDARWVHKKRVSAQEKKRAIEKAGVGGLDRHALTTLLIQYKVANEKFAYEVNQGKWILKDEVFEKTAKILLAVKTRLLGVVPGVTGEFWERIGKDEADRLLKTVEQKIIEALQELSGLEI